jgi:hypothetical protein
VGSLDPAGGVLPSSDFQNDRVSCPRLISNPLSQTSSPSRRAMKKSEAQSFLDLFFRALGHASAI